MNHKGIVIKIKDEYAIVLSDDNQFKRINLKNNIAVGQKIIFTNNDIIDIRKINKVKTFRNRKLMSIVATIVLIISIGLIGINNLINYKTLNSVVAFVTVDINPSFKISINRYSEVVKIDSLNDDSKTLNLCDVVGINVDEAIELIVSKSRIAGFINNEDLNDDYILITMIPVEKHVKVSDVECLIKDKISDSEELKNVNVAMIEATIDELIVAQDKNISVGLLAANGGEIDDKLTSVKDFFSNKNEIKTFEKKGKIIKKDFDKEVKLIGEYLNRLETEGVNMDNLRVFIDNSQKDFYEAKEFYNFKQKEYNKALLSGDKEKISSAKKLIEEKEQYRILMEQSKKDLEFIKEEIKFKLKNLETKMNGEIQKQDKIESGTNSKEDLNNVNQQILDKKEKDETKNKNMEKIESKEKDKNIKNKRKPEYQEKDNIINSKKTEKIKRKEEKK